MFFKILFFYFIGFLNIEVEGAFIERFINICKSRKILLWNIKMEKGVLLYANIGIKDYRNIREIAKKTNTKIKIKKKCGIPFILNRYKKRRGLCIILVLIIIGLTILSNFIWNISVEGNENIASEDILRDLEEEGLKIGKSKQNIKLNNIINNIRLKRNDIAWIGINIKGTNVRVEVKEKTIAPEIINKDEFCNIISDKEGMITKINVQDGTANVREGDIVRKGDILVSRIFRRKIYRN